MDEIFFPKKRLILAFLLLFLCKHQVIICQIDSLKEKREFELIKTSEWQEFILVEETDEWKRYIVPGQYRYIVLFLWNDGRFEYELYTTSLNFLAEGYWESLSDSTIYLEGKRILPNCSFIVRNDVKFFRKNLYLTLTTRGNILKQK